MRGKRFWWIPRVRVRPVRRGSGSNAIDWRTEGQSVIFETTFPSGIDHLS